MREVDMRVVVAIGLFVLFCWWVNGRLNGIDRAVETIGREATLREIRLLNGNTELMRAIYDETTGQVKR